MNGTQGVQTVLVVEDEPSYVDVLQIGLKKEGFRVEVARDGAQALELFELVNPDLVLLDVMLPRVSGIDVCRQIRKRSRIPIIMVTAKSAEIDTVVGLEVGADDYVTKPYRLRELVARMRAVLRRVPDERATDFDGEALLVGDVSLDPEQHHVVIRGEDTALPLKEFDLLHILLANAGRVLPRETLDRPGVGQRLRGRHEDPRRPHQTSAGEGRGRPQHADSDRHHQGPGLQVRTPEVARQRPLESARGSSAR